MFSKSVQIFLKPTVTLYNSDKLPAMQISEELADLMITTMFKEFKRALQNPYGFNIQLNQFAMFKYRYKHLRAHIGDNVDKIRYYRRLQERLKESNLLPNDISPSNRNFTVQSHYERVEEKIISIMKELKCQWQIKNSYMEIYTKTARYKRLVQLARTKHIDPKNHWATKEKRVSERSYRTEKKHKVWDLDLEDN